MSRRLVRDRYRALLFAVLGAGAIGSPTAHADQVQLSGGTQIEGKATRRGDQVVIETESGQIAVSADMVQHITRGQSPVQRYEEMERKLQPGDVAGRLALASYCHDHDMRSRETALLRQVLEIDTNQPSARARLGYVKTSTGWMTHDEQQRAQGLVKRDGNWLTPERAAELDRMRAEADAAVRDREKAEAELEAKRLEIAKRKLELAAEERRQSEPPPIAQPVYGYGAIYPAYRSGRSYGYGAGQSYSAPSSPATRPFPINGVRDPRDRSWPINGVRDPRSY